jgi:hypothetical protein
MKVRAARTHETEALAQVTQQHQTTNLTKEVTDTYSML